MNSVKILHCADVHIGAEESFLRFKAEPRRRETLLTFEKIVDLCMENQVQVLLVAGDLFNSNNVEKSFSDAVFAKIKSACGLRVVCVAGNHDPLSPNSPYVKGNLPQNLYIFGSDDSCISFPEINLRIYGRSFEASFLDGKEKPSLIPPEDGIINIALIHGELTSDLNSRYNAITKEYIESSNMDYIALGHVHKRSDIGKIGNTFFAYSGCPEGQGFDELGKKGVLMGEVGKGICNLEFVSTCRREHLLEKIDITENEITAEFILKLLEEKYGENYCENLYKIELTGSVSPHRSINISDISSRLNERLYFAKVKDNTHLKFNLEAIKKEQSLKSIFVKKMLEKIETADSDDKEKYENALKLGLSAFNGEVNINDN